MRKILIVSELEGGGVEKVNTLLAEYMDKTKYDVTVLSILGRGNKLNSKDIYFKHINLKCKSQSKAIIKMLRCFKLLSPDVIITSGSYDTYTSILYCKLFAIKCKSIYVHHSVYSENMKNKSFTQLFIHHYVCRVLNLYDKLNRVIFVSKGVKDDFLNLHKVDESKTRIIYNPIIRQENSIIEQTNSLKKTSDQLKTIKLVTIGRLEEEKDQVTIIRALEKLINKKVPVELFIVGEGSMKNTLDEYINLLGLADRVTFTGYINDVFSILRKCDLFLLSSKHESFGNVLIEAMYSGIPVLSTDCFCGPREIIGENKYGFLVPVGDYNALADKIEQVINSDNTELIYKAKKFSLNFTIEKSVGYYEKIIDELYC